MENRSPQSLALNGRLDVKVIKKEAFGLLTDDENSDALAFVHYMPSDTWIECVDEARPCSLGVESSDGLETRPHCSNSKSCEGGRIFGLCRSEGDGTHRFEFVTPNGKRLSDAALKLARRTAADGVG
jgi:hypothetical protein